MNDHYLNLNLSHFDFLDFVIFLTASPNFENTDRLKKILDFFEKKN